MRTHAGKRADRECKGIRINMNKFGVYDKYGEITLVFKSEAKAINHAKLRKTEWAKLIPNRWVIMSDWSDEDGIFIVESRKPEE